MKPVAPMLAVAADFAKLKFPILVQPKYDGIRCQMSGGVAYSRSHLLIPNRHIQKFAQENDWMHGLDGEWIVGDPQDPDVYNRTHRFVMTEDTDEFHPEARFYAFDAHDQPNASYVERHRYVHTLIKVNEPLAVRLVGCGYSVAHSREEVELEVQSLIESGFEGAILRDPAAGYKAGRATVKQGQLLKVKPWLDTEGIVVNTEPLMKNLNEAQEDNFGRTKRSSHQDNKQALDTLGALVLRLPWNGDTTEVSVGTGFTAAQRKELWDVRETLIGKLVKFKYMPFGSLNAPRHPVFIGFRHEADT